MTIQVTGLTELRVSNDQLRADRAALASCEGARGPSVQNYAPQAVHLERRGFTVVSGIALAEEATSAAEQLVASDRVLTPAAVVSGFKLAALRAVRRMQAFTARRRPPVRKGGPTRPAHYADPGKRGYGDVTTETARSFRYRVGSGGAVPVDYDGQPNR